MALKDKVVKAGFYLVLANIISQFSSIVVNIVLARLLFPEDFGLIALATTIIGFIIMFTSIGFGSSIIYERKSTHTQLSSLYWLNYITSIFTFIIVVLSANFADQEYAHVNYQTDFLSNGFKLRNTTNEWNGSGNTHVYMAFAEQPFKYANAR